MNTITALEDYFEFVRSATDDIPVAIRVAGTRVGIECILREYLQGASPEELALRFPTVNLEQIHATITYFLAQREEVSRYLHSVWQKQQTDWQAAQSTPSPFVPELARQTRGGTSPSARRPVPEPSR